MSATNTVADQATAKKALSVSAGVIEEVTKALAARCNVNGKVSVDKMDENQLVQYQIAWLTSDKKSRKSSSNTLGTRHGARGISNRKWPLYLRRKP